MDSATAGRLALGACQARHRPRGDSPTAPMDDIQSERTRDAMRRRETPRRAAKELAGLRLDACRRAALQKALCPQCALPRVLLA